MKNKNDVCVIIPIYKPALSDLEKVSFNQMYKILSNYPITIIHPQSLDLSYLLKEFPTLNSETFDNNYFTSTVGYNQLMLSTELYQRFIDYTYILIAQLDTYIFRDELASFCNKGYDYIGAPWLKKPLYQIWPYSYLLERHRQKNNKQGKPCRLNLFNKIGNGGLSLRKITSHIAALEKHKEKKDFYLSHPRISLYNEDIFWALEVPEFNFPSVKEALSFSIEKYPKYSLQLRKGNLPFGCHGWYKSKWKNFWKQHIDFPQ